MGNIFWKRPTASDLTSWKLKESDFPEPVVEVWEENWEPVCLYLRYANQWRMGPRGPAGLDFTVIHHALDRKGITGDDFDDFVDSMQVIERAALFEIYK